MVKKMNFSHKYVLVLNTAVNHYIGAAILEMQDTEFLIIGAKPEKHNQNILGSFILETKDKTKFSARPDSEEYPDNFQEHLIELWENKNKYIGRIATIQFQNYDAKSGVPIFPVLKSIL